MSKVTQSVSSLSHYRTQQSKEGHKQSFNRRGVAASSKSRFSRSSQQRHDSDDTDIEHYSRQSGPQQPSDSPTAD